MNGDRRGILSLPIKTAVAILIIALTLPMVAGAMDNARDSMDVSSLEEEAEGLMDAISRAYYGGTGTTVYADYSISPNESIELGGKGRDAYTMRLVRNGEVIGMFYIDRPAVPVIGKTSVSGHGSIGFKCVYEDSVYGIRAVP